MTVQSLKHKDMNKTELVKAIAEGASLSQADAKKALDVALESVSSALKKDEKVVLVGFGTFEVAVRQARQGVNPSSGEKIQIPARKVVKFKAGAALNDAVK